MPSSQSTQAINSTRTSNLPKDANDEENQHSNNAARSFTFGDGNEGEQKDSATSIPSAICVPCVPLGKKKKKEHSDKATCGACPSSGKNKIKDASSDEEESSSNFGSSVSSQEADEDLDLLTVGLEADMKWKTLEDLELERIESLAQHLRERIHYVRLRSASVRSS